MEQIQILDDEKFKEIYTNEELRNAVAFAHAVCNSSGEEEYRKALLYPVSYKVTQEQISKATEERDKKGKQVLKDNENNLLFVGMGMEFKPTIPEGIGNHRIRTEFINADGVRCFIEVGTGRTPEDNLRVDFAIYDHGKKDNNGYENHKNNYKNLERETPKLKYTYDNVLKLVNEYFNCHFKKIVVDYYNIRCDAVLCRSPLK